jgi:hypothetical protein
VSALTAEGFPGWWCAACRGPLGSIEPTTATRCPRCGAHAFPLDERLHDALTDAGLDEADAATALAAVLPLLGSDGSSAHGEPSEPLPVSVQSLGKRAVAEHPDGHRIVGIVLGCGTQGVILNSAPLVAGFLAVADGWTFTVSTR